MVEKENLSLSLKQSLQLHISQGDIKQRSQQMLTEGAALEQHCAPALSLPVLSEVVVLHKPPLIVFERRLPQGVTTDLLTVCKRRSTSFGAVFSAAFHLAQLQEGLNRDHIKRYKSLIVTSQRHHLSSPTQFFGMTTHTCPLVYDAAVMRLAQTAFEQNVRPYNPFWELCDDFKQQLAKFRVCLPILPDDST